MDERVLALQEAIRRFAKALAAGDTAALDSLLSLGYRHTDMFGRLWVRAEWLAQVGPEKSRSTVSDFGHFGFVIKGNLGIVTGIKHLHTVGARDGADENEPPTAFTQVWVWQQDRWLREIFQATPIVDMATP